MAVINRIASYAEEMTGWRHHLHAHPELGFDCHETAAFVATRLREFGITEIHDGIAESGLVAVIEGRGPGPTIGLRADMDALPMTEDTGHPYASTVPGRMHACGHDGHTTMLLGAAKYLAETRNFTGRVALIFQPAEESGGGGKVMCDAGIMDRFGITQVYGLHNVPGLEAGQFATRPGPVLAGADTFTVHLTGVGGHGAMPHDCKDPIIAAVAMVQAIQTILSRNHYAQDELVISVTQIHAGTTDNVIPEQAFLQGTVRSFDRSVQAMVIRRLEDITAGIATTHGVEARLEFEIGYPPTVNTPSETAFAAAVARGLVGTQRVDDSTGKEMGAEDFSYMLQARPGAFLFLGTGPGAALHHNAYDFNDEVAPVGASFFARLVETAQPLP